MHCHTMSRDAHWDANSDTNRISISIPVDDSTSDATAQYTRSETLERASKRQRLEKRDLSYKKQIEGYFDIDAEDDDEGRSDDEDEEETPSDLGWLWIRRKNAPYSLYLQNSLMTSPSMTSPSQCI